MILWFSIPHNSFLFKFKVNESVAVQIDISFKDTCEDSCKIENPRNFMLLIGLFTNNFQ